MINDCIFVRLEDMPCSLHGFTSIDNDGNYNVYINAKLGYDMNRQTLEHELKHINHAHFFSKEDVRNLEK